MAWEDELKFYDSLIALNPNFERKGKSMIYTSANGYMFTLLNKAGEIGFRLPKDVAAKFMEDYNTGPYYSYGAKMKDYVLVPKALYSDMDLLADYLQQSYEFVMSLPPK
ncbi:MAG: hypothetical protein AAF901_02240 [Bacteroidota bacterium]